jgi:predicted secreted protein
MVIFLSILVVLLAAIVAFLWHIADLQKVKILALRKRLKEIDEIVASLAAPLKIYSIGYYKGDTCGVYMDLSCGVSVLLRAFNSDDRAYNDICAQELLDKLTEKQ